MQTPHAPEYSKILSRKDFGWWLLEKTYKYSTNPISALESAADPNQPSNPSLIDIDFTRHDPLLPQVSFLPAPELDLLSASIPVAQALDRVGTFSFDYQSYLLFISQTPPNIQIPSGKGFVYCVPAIRASDGNLIINAHYRLLATERTTESGQALIRLKKRTPARIDLDPAYQGWDPLSETASNYQSGSHSSIPVFGHPRSTPATFFDQRYQQTIVGFQIYKDPYRQEVQKDRYGNIVTGNPITKLTSLELFDVPQLARSSTGDAFGFTCSEEIYNCGFFATNLVRGRFGKDQLDIDKTQTLFTRHYPERYELIHFNRIS